MVGKVSYPPALNQGSLSTIEKEMMIDGPKQKVVVTSGGLGARPRFEARISGSTTDESENEADEMALGLPDRYVGVCLLGKGGYGTVL